MLPTLGRGVTISTLDKEKTLLDEKLTVHSNQPTQACRSEHTLPRDVLPGSLTSKSS